MSFRSIRNCSPPPRSCPAPAIRLRDPSAATVDAEGLDSSSQIYTQSRAWGDGDLLAAPAHRTITAAASEELILPGSGEGAAAREEGVVVRGGGRDGFRGGATRGRGRFHGGARRRRDGASPASLLHGGAGNLARRRESGLPPSSIELLAVKRLDGDLHGRGPGTVPLGPPRLHLHGQGPELGLFNVVINSRDIESSLKLARHISTTVMVPSSTLASLLSKYYTSNIETMMELGIFSCVLLKRKLIVEDDLTESLPSAAHVQMIIIKATGLDGTIPPAWVGTGIAYAAQDEGDQAMAVFRTAVQLFHGCHLPTLYMGMQYLGMHNSKLAEQFFMEEKYIQ